MSIINAQISNSQNASIITASQAKKDKASEKSAAKGSDTAAAVTVSESNAGRHAKIQEIRNSGIMSLNGGEEAQAFMDSMKAGMLSDARSTIMAQSEQNSERVFEIIA